MRWIPGIEGGNVGGLLQASSAGVSFVVKRREMRKEKSGERSSAVLAHQNRNGKGAASSGISSIEVRLSRRSILLWFRFDIVGMGFSACAAAMVFRLTGS